MPESVEGLVVDTSRAQGKLLKAMQKGPHKAHMNEIKDR
jgi:hypothetical protein